MIKPNCIIGLTSILFVTLNLLCSLGYLKQLTLHLCYIPLKTEFCFYLRKKSGGAHEKLIIFLVS